MEKTELVQDILHELKSFGEEVTDVTLNNGFLLIQYKGYPLNYEELKSLEAIANATEKNTGFNRFIPFKFNGEYSLSIPLPA